MMENLPQSMETRQETSNPSTFRQLLPQVLACSAKSVLYLSLGMLVGLPTLLIPDVTDPSNLNELFLDNDQASWYGSLTYIFQPLGSLASGALLQSVGCKKLMIMVNIPQFVSWIMTYYASSALVLYISSALVGLVVGLMEAPTCRYISEITHPNYRGVLTSYSTSFVTVGFLLVYALGLVTNWRNVALISASTPVLAIIVLLMIPETPIWLMSKGRSEEALESLQWLRGWTTKEAVQEEYTKLQFYAKKQQGKTIHAYGKEVDIADEKPTVLNGASSGGHLEVEEVEERRGLKEKIRELTCKEMLVPLGKCIVLFFVSICSGLLSLRPYFVQVFEEFDLPTDGLTTSVLISVIAIVGNIVCMLIINRVKKRPLIIFSLISTALCLILLALFLMAPTNPHNNASLRWWSLILFLIVNFVNNLGIYPISWTYLSEILPYRGRGIATAIGSSFFYIVIAVGVKTYPSLEQQIGLDGIFLLYAVISLAGAYFTYFSLPETEGKFLSDIETHGKDKKIQVTSF
nr:PREDICTED: facilitated trehalose transporter Tret1-like isoform X1 [Bemisia tabaci]XP_018900031.1 PREDICTED: facilitated trehalose transporter Tret1-like isoform X1 [Bemisia tabaci]XP_018900033.1 PREDICTED: facilitated trehalose transporter Tret1-like isoform X1 [Bemisia tabaci]